ncbi:phosphatase PAP2/dual specificity phosphatase family protein [Xenophilus arseniciresistens]|uniref:Phosphatase PAP2/dual specificity phosphatase family protein n=1 Tax=Xenophilus arseniciresistens TaxID=1283306 RepID=A0AAE3T0F5_9BURK|nr:phosphatase PAP2/dual specificity phosphatase family protein [Xenophilus arseniciresistens]MDA7416856.1 phosphatase PAP2/dual specificity phosphatase family protein [Xenophilus arseniciresistens]
MSARAQPPGRPWKRAAAWLACLGPLFYLSYGLANWWAGTRAQVPSVVFGWEHGMPFWAWTIFPYWSINAFYALSLFLGRSRHEVDRHGARLLTAQFIAVSCFVLWPLHFSFGQPEVSGAPAFLFNALRGFDQPYNQAPSLHIALAVILWDWYRRLVHARWARAVLHVWALLICGSVLTTYQHHFIDIPTGALLGLVCVWLWPLERRAALPRAWRMARDAQRWKLAAFYTAGAVLCLALALWLQGAALWLCWPAASLALVALNYIGFGARGFAMDAQGRMGWAARWLYAPYRAGAALNAWLWTRRLPASVAVAPGLHLGRVPDAAEWEAAGRPHLLGLCAELQLPAPAAAAGRARSLPLLDLVVPAPARLRRAATLIEAQRRRAGPEGAVWVCCALGFSRSAAALIAFLLTGQGHSAQAAQQLVRAARPQIVLRERWMQALGTLSSRAQEPPQP